MEYPLSIILLLLFLSLVVIYMFCGIYIIRLNSKESTNRLFLLMCISMSIWSLGFGMANAAVNMETALFWNRFSSIGWTTAYSLMLHFLLILSHKKVTLKQKRLFRLVHIPAIISLYVFGFSNKMAPIQYNLQRVNYGWINKPTNNRWDLFFNSYYIAYVLISIFLIWKWQRNLKNKTVATGAQRMIKALGVSFIIGTFTDRIVSVIFENPLPQMAPVFILIPTWAMYHSARYYGVMAKENIYVKDIIATKEEQKHTFVSLSMAFYIGAILAFVSEYFTAISANNDLKNALAKGLTLLAIGVIIRMIQNIKKQSLKENLTLFVLVSSIPMITLQYLQHGSVTIWVFPMVIIISSIIFSKRTLLISTTVVSISTQIIIWILRPEATVVITQYDYIVRIGIFIIAFLMGSYVNNLYVTKIKENKYQIKLQKMNLELSLDFANINQENFDEKINIMLAKIGLLFGVDRTYICLINHEHHKMTYSHHWFNNKIKTEVEADLDTYFPVSTWFVEQLQGNRLVYIEDSSQMPDVALWERELLMLKEVKSLVAAPIKDNSVIQGFIGVDTTKPLENWSEEKIEFLSIVSNLLSSGINKIESEKEINFMAYHDYLTKLPNRFLFADRVNKAVNLAKETGHVVSVIFMDLDNFKIVNDIMGHSSGDYLLRKIADVLGEVVQKNGTVSRSGGDEFMIMLNNMTDHNEILKIADKLMALFLKPFNINGRDFAITASAGISIYPVDGEDSEALVKNADLAMYRAKETGKNKYVLCTADMKQEVQMNMKLSNDMYQALERDEFVVYYQPQIDLATGAINGLEALLRWNHPEKGMISPGIFIPLAENNGMINSIGEWVLKTACTQNKKWQDMGLGKLAVAVNLSGVQFADPHIANNVESILKEAGLDPKYLEIEITESIAIRQEVHAEEVLRKLKKIGICIAIDDFGTEYSSLNRLKVLPIDRIKIDMQFTQGIESNEKDRAIVLVIINLAKKLGMNVIAEGAETKQQIEFLCENACDDVQGYYYYKPMPAEEIEKKLAGCML